MDKVFADEAMPSRIKPHLVPVDVDIHEPAPKQQTAEPAPAEQSHSNNWLLPVLTGVAVAGVVSSGWLIVSLRNSNQQLDQERNLALIERLRSIESATQQQDSDARPEQTVAPPPPETGLIKRLEPLTLPIHPLPKPSVALPAPETATRMPSEQMPQLTGVVQGPGANSSAIFQLGEMSFSAGLGEVIGSSDWTLKSVNETSAVIERQGEERALSVGGVF